MSYTKQFDAVQGSWTIVIQGQTDGFVQLKDPGPVLVHVGQDAPAADSEDAIELSEEGLMEFTITGMEAGDEVRVRCRHNETNRVVAHAAGTAPA